MISAVILTKNEEENIKECLSGLKWCDEVIVIDDNSTDRTIKIAEENRAKVINHSLNNDFSAQRNYGLGLATGDWVFFVDADERVTPKLAEEIKKGILESKDLNGFWVKRIDFFIERWLRHGEIGGIKLLRLARKRSGRWERRVDEKWEVGGKTKVLKNSLLHYSHRDLTEFLQSINERSTLNARELYEEDERVTFLDWFKPLAKFFVNFFLKFGFLDGVHGFVFATMMSLHSFLVRGKLYLLWRKREG